jgi:uncharacterized membrane protein YcjF (UPF0283 family)
LIEALSAKRGVGAVAVAVAAARAERSVKLDGRAQQRGYAGRVAVALVRHCGVVAVVQECCQVWRWKQERERGKEAEEVSE